MLSLQKPLIVMTAIVKLLGERGMRQIEEESPLNINVIT